MAPDPSHHRRPVRLPESDYALSAAYFVTLVTQDRANRFGELSNGEMRLNSLGKIIESTWNTLPDHFPLHLDVWVIMPNHFHGIVWICEDNGKQMSKVAVGAKRSARYIGSDDTQPGRMLRPSRPTGTKSGSLNAIVQNFKSVTTRKINAFLRKPGQPLWQRNYFEHVIQDDDDLERVRRYIQTNPLYWDRDPEHG